MTAHPLAFVRDKWFAVALLAGPLVWVGLWLFGYAINTTTPPWKPYLLTALIYPVLEEIVFRGGLQSALLDRHWGRQLLLPGVTTANAITSIAFTALHLFSQPPLWATLVVAPSLIFGWARDRFDQVVPSIVLHVVYNAGFGWLFVHYV